MKKKEFANKMLELCLSYLEEDPEDNFDAIIAGLESLKHLLLYKQIRQDKRIK